MSKTQSILERASKVLVGNYARMPVVMTRGEGSRLWDADGREYLDLFAGFGGTILGHAHPDLVQAATAQVRRLWAVGNTYHSEPQVELAERIARHAFDGRAFFCHSGAEANEAACKLARLAGGRHSPPRWKIISLERSFHGRTLAMIAATGNPKYREGFGPPVSGFVNVPSFDLPALERAIDAETCGIMMEPIQGEGGIHAAGSAYYAAVRDLCDQRGLTLIFDEVWTGCGRTGRWFGHQHHQSDGRTIRPDILTLGKALGGGLPVGCMFARPELAALLTPGTHGCTLGGNPVCMAVAAKVFEVIERDQLVDHAARLGDLAVERLGSEPRLKGKVREVRGRGLMLGVDLASPPERFMDKALERGLALNLTAGTVVRVAPAINISRLDFERGLEGLVDLLASL